MCYQQRHWFLSDCWTSLKDIKKKKNKKQAHLKRAKSVVREKVKSGDLSQKYDIHKCQSSTNALALVVRAAKERWGEGDFLQISSFLKCPFNAWEVGPCAWVRKGENCWKDGVGEAGSLYKGRRNRIPAFPVPAKMTSRGIKHLDTDA